MALIYKILSVMNIFLRFPSVVSFRIALSLYQIV